jgi:hypothetical protein
LGAFARRGPLALFFCACAISPQTAVEMSNRELVRWIRRCLLGLAPPGFLIAFFLTGNPLLLLGWGVSAICFIALFR